MKAKFKDSDTPLIILCILDSSEAAKQKILFRLKWGGMVFCNAFDFFKSIS